MADLSNDTIDGAFRKASQLAGKAVEKVRAQNPDATDAQLIKKLESMYFKTVTTSGAATGGVAAIPGAGTAAALASGVWDATFFLTASAAHVLAVANVSGIPAENCQRQRSLLLTVLSGGEVGGEVAAAGGRGAQTVPNETIRSMNKTIGAQVIRKYAMKRGIVVLGKAAPFGIGAAIGAGGNYVMARSIIKATRKAFADIAA